MRAVLTSALMVVALVVASCGGSATPTSSPSPSVSPAPSPTPTATAKPSPTEGAIADIEFARADVARQPASPAAAKAAGTSINAFGVDLYRLLLDDPEHAASNAVFSPASIALALGMARAGARGETAAEMDDVLHVNGWEELSAGLNALDQALASRNATWTGEDAAREVALRIANASFGQRGWSIEQPFLDAIASTFGAGLRLVDYMADPDAARRAINEWVSNETAGRIPELLGPPDVSTVTRLYLVNAIYLKAEWERWFQEDRTELAEFTRLDGSKVLVPMMHDWRGFSDVVPYARGTGWRAIELRYMAPPDSPPLAMVFVLPDDLTAFETTLSGDGVAAITAALDEERRAFEEPTCPATPVSEAGCYPYDVELFLPRFSIETRAELGDLLEAAGMPLAFDPDAADFTGIHVPEFPGEQLYISKVIHQANIDVDEKGTEAAAATAVGMDTGGGPSPLEQHVIRLDRPFLFLLRDVETGAVLFMGRVVDPSITR